ncbi:hypothetical protein SNEBB_009164 [Seison nebaliae]|nr:hypothetical protein SNEBB_009164 [Seison nebaliae]
MGNEDKTILIEGELYLSNLDENITEDELVKLFRSYGEVEKIEIKELPKGGKYALVNYLNDEDARNVMNELNFTVLFENEIHISRSLTKYGRQSNEGNIIIRNLPPSMTARRLFQYLVDEFGEILSFKLTKNRFAYVHFLHERDAEKFTAKYNEKSLSGYTLKVTQFIPKNERKLNDNPFTNIYIKNFGYFLEDESLMKMFEEFGEIISAVVMKDNRGRSKGFGFINFSNWESAEKAIEKMDQSIIQVPLKSTLKNKKNRTEERRIYVGKALTKEEREAERETPNPLKFIGCPTLSSNSSDKCSESEELIIKNIDKHMPINTIYNHFRRYGEIKSFNVTLLQKDQMVTVSFKYKLNLEKIMGEIKVDQFGKNVSITII